MKELTFELAHSLHAKLTQLAVARIARRHLSANGSEPLAREVLAMLQK